uniref:Uncharacterized protein n=1 Tax=Kryptolebias marmoratus TaxID=37003 RepID=A0A3Q3BI28_KRYMA
QTPSVSCCAKSLLKTLVLIVRINPVHLLPAVLEAGSKAVFCVSLSQPSHHVTLTVTLKAEESDKVLLRKGTSIGFHKCYLFMVPLVPKDEVQKFKVEVISHGFYSREVKKVLIKVLNPRTFIQTDKPIYNPGQTVQFRVVTLNSKLKPADGLVSISTCSPDPHNNKIGAWANETSSSRILQLSYSLNSEALEGFYRIVVQQGGEIFYHSFKVQKYGKLDQFFFKPSSLYKHGKPVKGDIKVRVCRPLKNYQSCTPALIQKNSKEISLTSLCKTKQKEVVSMVTVSSLMKITYLIGRLSFVEIPKTYTHGTELVGKVKAVDYDGKPVPQLSLYLLCGERGYEVQAVTTNEDGVADFSINTHKLRGDVLVRRREMKKIAFYEPAKFRVYASGLGRLSAGFLRILPYTSPLRCGEQEEITIEYGWMMTVEKYLLFNTIDDLLPVSVNNGQFFITIRVKPDFTPYIQVVAYVVLRCDKVLAHSAKFPTEKCFKNPFSPSPALPGGETKLCVKAEPISLCGVSLVELNVLKRSSGKILDADKILDLLPFKKTNSIPSELEDPLECMHVRPKRHAALAVTNQERNDAYAVFEVCIIYSLKSKLGFVCICCSREHGKTCVSYTVPETMNTWETEIYCLSPHSFGLAPRILLSVFRPFSLDFTLTSTLVLGESLILKAKVINHLQTCIKVKVTPSASSDFILTTQANDQFTFCLCAGKHKKIRWIFTPSVIGDVNVVLTAEAVPSQTPCCDQQVYVPEKGHIVVVKRSLTVKAVGIEIIKTQSWLFCPKGQYVAGSALVSVCLCAGDIFSQRLKYLGQLLQLPYGCGEQNIALMAMNTDILHYLQNAHLLSEETRKKGSYLLTNGYQRQLIYKDKKGAFSTFGSGPGNTWLTAFGMITFYKAQAFIYIDPRIIEESRKWLECQQLKNGCFKVSGKLFNDKIRGGVPDELTLTAYVTAAFLEMETPTNVSKYKLGLYCLRESVNDFSNIYTTALLAYVYTLLGDTETRTTLLVHLDSVAKREGDLLYWCPTAENSSPLCVETTAYVMLAKLSSTLSASDLTCASSIVRWLIRQQNYHGGFVSTQDSAVALKALALYATLVPSPEGSSLVTVSSPSDHLLFHVNSENKQVYQEMMLQDLKGKYWLKAEGYACTSVQVSDTLFCYVQLHKDIPVYHELQLVLEDVVLHLKPSTSC